MQIVVSRALSDYNLKQLAFKEGLFLPKKLKVIKIISLPNSPEFILSYLEKIVHIHYILGHFLFGEYLFHFQPPNPASFL